ncbi:putative baseplate assembly protein, partial [Candidatus Zixiibacteriota bacterium]
MGYVREWEPTKKGPGGALASIFARYLHAVLQRLNQAAGKNKLAFLDQLGLYLVQAQSARAPIVFQLADDASSGEAPENTAVAAPPKPEETEQVVFETERALGIAAGKLVEVYSLWPGRDEYIDHSTAFLAGESIQPFDRLQLKATPHYLYISHATLLA